MVAVEEERRFADSVDDDRRRACVAVVRWVGGYYCKCILANRAHEAISSASAVMIKVNSSAKS